MAPTTGQIDPRTIVTPDAFQVSEELLGLQLASPRRRAVALLIDGVLIFFLSVVTRSFALMLGVVAAVFFIRAGFKRTPVKGSVFGRAMRGSVGCLGIFIGLMTALIWSSCGTGFGPSFADDDEDDVPQSLADAGLAGSLAGNLVGLALAEGFESAESLDEVIPQVEGLIEVAREVGMDDDDIEDFLVARIPADAAWSADADTAFSRLIRESSDEEPEGIDADELAAAEEAIAQLSDQDLFDLYLSSLDSDDPSDAARAAMRNRLADLVAADTLDALAERIEDLEDDVDDARQDLAQNQAALSEATSATLWSRFLGFLDDLGFGFGWSALYLTIFLSSWNGQTPGKRMLGIRVMRLDGEPINWWIAFERGGGYAAGLATGLLGFAQVYWDANRQGIHDRIVGTVVVREGAERVTDWEEAL